MPILWVRYKDQTLGQYLLRTGASLTIGRRQGNDIVIDNLAVSGSHAKIDWLNEGVLLTDLGSKNGTFVNGQLVTSAWIKRDDVITIGKHTMVLTWTEGEKQPPAPAPDQLKMDKTMVLDTDQYRTMLDKSAPDLIVEADRKEPTAVVSFLKGGRGEVVLRKKLSKIGKDRLNDIVISGFLVGKTAATISKRPAGFYLSYVEGIAKPRVNGKKVTGSVKLQDFDVIDIGPTRLEFVVKE